MGRQINFLIPGVHSIFTSTVKRRKYFCCQLLVRYNFTDPEGCSWISVDIYESFNLIICTINKVGLSHLRDWKLQIICIYVWCILFWPTNWLISYHFYLRTNIVSTVNQRHLRSDACVCVADGSWTGFASRCSEWERHLPQWYWPVWHWCSGCCTALYSPTSKIKFSSGSISDLLIFS